MEELPLVVLALLLRELRQVAQVLLALLLPPVEVDPLVVMAPLVVVVVPVLLVSVLVVGGAVARGQTGGRLTSGGCFGRAFADHFAGGTLNSEGRGNGAKDGWPAGRNCDGGALKK